MTMKPNLFANRRIGLEQSRYFDMWRGGAAIVVLLGHAVPLYFEGEIIFPALAGAAVMAFFGLSGFFIHKSLAKNTREGVFVWKEYGAARFNRIIPTFIFALFVTWACWAIAPMVFQSGTREYLTPTIRESISLDGFLRTALFLNGILGPTVSANGPLWSLAYEVWFYFGAALLFLGMTGKRIGWVGLALFPLLFVADPWFVVWGACWLSGFGVSVLHASDMLGWANRRLMLVSALLPIGGLVLIIAIPDLWFWTTRLFQVLFSVWFTIHMAETLQSKRLFHSRSIVATASFSYSLYVVHFPMLLLFYGIDEASYMAVIAVLSILVFAAVVGKWVETIKPFPRPSAVAMATRPRQPDDASAS
ncbi:MAG: acyltransferase [Erythrobacter sp.]|nr:acyltransferase [Erythrobacter sp.]NCQ63250.1 acyltransferase [Alphaproteobacteria bacterium]